MKQKLSALLDGALDEDASARMLDALRRDGVLRREWDTYCLIGDTLRDDEVALSTDFTRKVMSAIEDEPALVTPVKRAGGQGLVRHLMPIAASVMGVAAVGVVAGNLSNGLSASQLAARTVKAPVVALAAARPSSALENPVPVAVSEPSEREYLFAHQAMAPAAGMPGVAQYLRTVAETPDPGAR